MPVFIYEPDAFEKICQVEGDEYRDLEIQESFGECSFAAFKARWEGVIKENPELKNVNDDSGGISINGNYVIYGWLGYHRYAVNYSGEIIFLEQFAFPQARAREIIERAKKVGFRTKF